MLVCFGKKKTWNFRAIATFDYQRVKPIVPRNSWKSVFISDQRSRAGRPPSLRGKLEILTQAGRHSSPSLLTKAGASGTIIWCENFPSLGNWSKKRWPTTWTIWWESKIQAVAQSLFVLPWHIPRFVLTAPKLLRYVGNIIHQHSCMVGYIISHHHIPFCSLHRTSFPESYSLSNCWLIGIAKWTGLFQNGQYPLTIPGSRTPK